jgi:hypothetical protein
MEEHKKQALNYSHISLHSHSKTGRMWQHTILLIAAVAMQDAEGL